jgi:hypothetical protein
MSRRKPDRRGAPRDRSASLVVSTVLWLRLWALPIQVALIVTKVIGLTPWEWWVILIPTAVWLANWRFIQTLRK